MIDILSIINLNRSVWIFGRYVCSDSKVYLKMVLWERTGIIIISRRFYKNIDGTAIYSFTEHRKDFGDWDCIKNCVQWVDHGGSRFTVKDTTISFCFLEWQCCHFSPNFTVEFVCYE